MMEKYTEAELQIVAFETEDVVTASDKFIDLDE